MQQLQVPNCKYSTGKCQNPLTFKQIGKYYAFCDYHRKKACKRRAQKKTLHKKRKVPQMLQQLQEPIKPSKPVIHHAEIDFVLGKRELQHPFPAIRCPSFSVQ